MENFKICGFFVLVLLLKVFGLSDAKEVQCESIRTYSWVGPVGAVKTCLMNKTTSIDGPGVTILPRDETIKGLSFGYLSYKISHLPENVAESFPNLEIYEANTCAVTEITKQNFNGLVKLKVLFLAGNRIETIADDTFESLVALELINLTGNKIKSMNGEVFKNLNKLSAIQLKKNVCIDEDFGGSTEIATLEEKVNEKCSAIKPTLAVLAILFCQILMTFAF